MDFTVTMREKTGSNELHFPMNGNAGLVHEHDHYGKEYLNV